MKVANIFYSQALKVPSNIVTRLTICFEDMSVIDARSYAVVFCVWIVISHAVIAYELLVFTVGAFNDFDFNEVHVA